ncbi:LysR family transcriptional regulator [Streptococcus sp. sy004]|uniref:LysR family transcriptional regulator n=1 Tax=Streptococcus sp. sy004 TaxID=2600149 RepID=UPI0011B4BAFB|nr:LysR family transcriptional regulator [Streptococcus sp. sy004]TWT12427.1 LysR family transcriptional regulator [Streptococcus sp. sy004]
MLDFRVFTFLKVCETLNFTQAAKELHITQPAVTKHIQMLELEYQMKLFHFKGKQCQLTQDGKALLELIVTMNNDLKHFKNRQSQKNIPLNFGATLTIGEFVLTDVLLNLLAKNKALQVKMLVDNTETLLKSIDQGLIDFALIEGFFSKEKYDALSYRKEPFVAVAAPDLILSQKAVTLESLLAYPLIIREQGSGTRELLELTLKEANLSIHDFQKVTEIGNLNIIKTLVKHQLGITFVYQSVVQQELDKGELIIIPIQNLTISHDFTFIWRKNSQFKSRYQDIFKLFKP